MLKVKKILKKTSLYKPLKKARNFLAGQKERKILARLEKDGQVPAPRHVTFEPTTKCNLDCRMCYQKQERALGKKDLSLEQIKRIFKRLRTGQKINKVSLIGAEVFMRPDIFEIIDYLGNLGIKVYLQTNGTLINKQNINRLRQCKNITGLGFSLDGPKELHNQIRGQAYAFDKLMEALALTKNDFSLTVNSVIMEENIDRLAEVARLLKEEGISDYSLQFEMIATPKDAEHARAMLDLEESDLAIDCQENDAYSFKLSKLTEILEKLKKIKGLNVLIQPTIFYRHPKLYFNGLLRQGVKLRCKDMLAPRINAQGEIIFCPFIKKTFGSLPEQDFEEIWNGQEMKKFRLKLLQNNLTPVCKRCCRLGERQE